MTFSGNPFFTGFPTDIKIENKKGVYSSTAPVFTDEQRKNLSGNPFIFTINKSSL